MERIVLMIAAVLFPMLAVGQVAPAAEKPSPDAHEIGYAVVRASHLQYLNAGDVQGLRELLNYWVASDAQALAARVMIPALASTSERARSLRALRLIAALHERHPVPQIASNPETLAGLELAKADNPCEFKLNQGRDWSKPLAPLYTAQCEATGK